MAKYIHNLTESTKEYQGRQIEANSYFLIPPPLYKEYSQDNNLITDITSLDIKLSRDGIVDLDSVENSLNLLKDEDLRVSIAIDKNNTDQSIEDTDAVVIEADRILWDLEENFDIDTNNFIVPLDGVYFFDCQIKVKDFSNVDMVEIAIYKRGSPDDYWFNLDKKSVNIESELQLSCGTSFDFYKDEEYTIKIKLTKVTQLLPCSCTIDGNDDYTAWGFSLTYPF